MVSSLYKAALAALGLLLSSLGAAALVYLMVLSAGGRDMNCGGVHAAQEAPVGTFFAWLVGLLGPGMGLSWSCHELSPLVGLVGRSTGLVLMVLTLSLTLAVFIVALEVRLSVGQQKSSRLGAAVFMAPPVLWASFLMIVVNLGVVFWAVWVDGSASELLLPGGPTWLKLGVSVLVLSLGGGTIWDLVLELRTTVGETLREEYVHVARANGLSVIVPVLRNVAIPVATRLVGKVPVLFGEVIIIEFIFNLEGTGRVLVQLVESRDAPALMTITLLLVAITIAMREGLHFLEFSLFPARIIEGEPASPAGTFYPSGKGGTV